MDKESWIGGQDAVDRGFADALLPSDAVDASAKTAALPTAKIAAQLINDALARGEKLPRAKRRLLLKALNEAPRDETLEHEAMPGAGSEDGTPGAADDAISPIAQARLSASLALLKCR